MKLYGIILWFLLFNTVFGWFQYEDTKRLLKYLFEESGYDKYIRPVKNSSTITKVNISYTIRSISNIDVINGLMCSYSFITITLKDELLTWNSYDYGGITELQLPPDKHWNPQLEQTLAGACKDIDVEDNTQTLNTTLSYDGTIFVHQAKSIGAMCRVDMKMFPFDSHTCVHQFFTFRYTPSQLQIHFSRRNVIDKIYYVENQEWNVEKSGINVSEYKDSLSSMFISYATSVITVKRRPGFMIINTFAQNWLVSILIIFAPLIPPDCERLSFSVTSYLAMIFMSVSFVSYIPRNSIEIIVISQTMLAFISISTTSIIWSIFIVCLSKVSSERQRSPTY